MDEHVKVPVATTGYGLLASEPTPEGGGNQMPTVGRVSVSLDHEAGEGWMFVHPDASTKEIQEALEQIADAGFEELDFQESGDDIEWDSHGREKIPLVCRWE